MLEDANSRPLLGDPVIRKYGEPFSIQFDSETVAILYVVPPPAMSNATDFAFVRSQQRAIWVIAGSALLIALLVAAALGAWMVRPVKAVAAAAGALAKGDYGVRIQSRRGDELGELARDFDQLAGALESNRRERRHLLADISHELRTPLSVLRGELDAVQDGIRPLNQRTVTALDAEVYRLSSLIDDLNELAQSDIGGMTYCVENASLVALIDQVVSDFAIDCERAQLNVAFDKPEGGKSTISADPARIEQLLRNLMRNSIRYTDGPGRIRIRLYSQDQGFLIDWEDSAPDVPKASLSQLFDRLYRVDTSRSRATGGAGIGLSIVRNVAQAHGGDVSASISSLGGLKISIYLPKIKADV